MALTNSVSFRSGFDLIVEHNKSVDQRCGPVERSRHRPRSDETAEMTNRRRPARRPSVGRLVHCPIRAFAHCQLRGPYLAEQEPHTRSSGPIVTLPAVRRRNPWPVQRRSPRRTVTRLIRSAKATASRPRPPDHHDGCAALSSRHLRPRRDTRNGAATTRRARTRRACSYR